MEKIKRHYLKILEIKKHFGKIFFIIFLFLFTFFILSFYLNIKKENLLNIIFFDIGQGDSSLIKMPNGEKILIDAGPNNLIVKKLENYFSLFDRDIDYILMTHPDADHISGFYFVAENFNIKNILENGDRNKNTDIFKNIENIFKKENIEDKEIFVNCGDILDYENFDKPRIFIFHPRQDSLVSNDTNENSIVALLTYDKYSFLFTGDMDEIVEKNLFNEIDKCFSFSDINFIKQKLKNLTVLKVSHHGSKTASSKDFLKILKPEYSVISVGKNNRYGHPNDETLDNLKKYSKNIFDTSKDGDIIFNTDGENFEFKKEK
ncbi:MAG: MBL fold metallo-hydrolase [Candidatus Pacebacteria bacterium]|nr:MBL fold metallo-hydrolase [Candidatus Paceibacterota bacterium]